MRVLRKLSLATMLLLIGCRPDVSEHFGGRDKATLVASARIVRAWRTVGSLKKDQELTDSDVAKLWQKSGDPIVVPTNLAANLIRILSNKRSYDYYPGQAKASVCEPCVVFNFSNGSNSVDVFLSFADDSMVVTSPTPLDSDPHDWLGRGDIERSRVELVRTVKAIFPHDAQIRSLNENKSDGGLWPTGAQGR